MRQSGRIAVLGAGIVGLCTALYLRRDGHDVVVIDRDAPGRGASFGNAGLLQVEGCVPLATPGVLRRAPGMLLDREGPLVVRWGYLPRIAPWLLRFAAAARPQTVERISASLAALLDRALAAYAPLVDAAGAHDLLRPSGVLFAYRTDAAYRAAQRDHALRRRRGVRLEELGRDEIRQFEPALTPEVKRAVFAPDCMTVDDPLALTSRFADSFLRGGGVLLREEVTDIETGVDGVRRVVTGAGGHDVDRLVVAAGAFSRPWAAKLGAPAPLDTERGYHLMLPEPKVALRRPVLVGDHRFAIVPMGGGIRLAGTAELAGLAAPPDFRRAEMLLPMARRLLPGLDGAGRTRWMGFRPSMPDSLPVIGRSPRFANACLAFGHGHLGLTLGAVTGRLIADLTAGRDPGIDMTPYRPDRF